MWRISPEGISAHSFHEVIGTGFCDPLHTSGNTGIGEEDVKSAILLQHLVDEALNIRFLGGVDLAGVYVNPWVQALDLSRVDVKQIGFVVADEDCFGAIASELMRSCPADAVHRVGTCDDDDFVFDASLGWSA